MWTIIGTIALIVHLISLGLITYTFTFYDDNYKLMIICLVLLPFSFMVGLICSVIAAI